MTVVGAKMTTVGSRDGLCRVLLSTSDYSQVAAIRSCIIDKILLIRSDSVAKKVIKAVG